jgi:hypothetical protein
LYLCFERALRSLLARRSVKATPLLHAFAVAATFVAVTLAWVPFRAPDTTTAVRITRALFGESGLGHVVINLFEALVVIATLGGILVSQNWVRDASLEEVTNRAPSAAFTLALAAIFFSIAVMSGDDRSFIYFQF